jgi:hypothetical protein
MTGSPRDLDTKFKDATIPTDAESEDSTERNDAKESPAEPKGGYIVYKQTYVGNDGVQREKVHGPMPVSEWADYEKENNL